MTAGLAEGHTPLEAAPALAAWAGLEQLWVKREDLNPTGSHKDRGARRQIEACTAGGHSVAVIPSSGNAALAAATYGAAAGVTVVALLSPLTEASRVAELEAAGARVVLTSKPINFALRLSRVLGWPGLRPSLSPEALSGFRGLGEELLAQLPGDLPVFGYASSGTTFQAIGEVFADASRAIPLHPVQAGLVNGFSREFGRPGDGVRSLVGDLGVKVSPRASRVLELVRASGGQAWWVGDPLIREGRAALTSAGLRVAPECWAAVAGLREAARALHLRAACLLLTGRAPAEAGGPAPSRPVAHTFAEVLAQVGDLR